MALKHVKYHIVKRIASPGLMYDPGCSGLMHWDDPEGWDGEGGGRGIQDGEHKYTLMADSSQCMAKPIQYCKLINQLKNTKIRSLQLWKIKLSFCIKKKKRILVWVAIPFSRGSS